MAQLLDQLRVLTEHIILSLGYVGIAAVMLIENLFPPIPSEIVVPFAGFLVYQGKLNLPGVLFASTLGAVLGAIILYYIGVWLGEARLYGLIRRYGRWFLLSEEDLTRSIVLFRRQDRSIVFLARLLPGVRSLISIPAGVARMPLGPFLLFTTLGTLVWNVLLSLAGIFLGQNWPQVLGLIDRYELFIWAALLLGVGVFVWRRAGQLSSRA